MAYSLLARKCLGVNLRLKCASISFPQCTSNHFRTRSLRERSCLTISSRKQILNSGSALQADHYQDKPGTKNLLTSQQLQQRSSSSSSMADKTSMDNVYKNFGKRFGVDATELRDCHRGEWPKITLFGDSITRLAADVDRGCWASMISNRVLDYFDVDVRGFPGYNTTWAVEAMPKLFPRSYLDKVEVFVEFFGHNDTWLKSPLGISLEEFEQNIRSMLEYLQYNGLDRSKIIIVSPAWYYHPSALKASKEANWGEFHGKTYEHALNYTEALRTISKEKEITFLDFFEATINYPSNDKLFYDGIHFSKTGAKLMFDNLWPLLEEKILQNFGKPVEQLFHITPVENIPSVQEEFKKRSDKM